MTSLIRPMMLWSCILRDWKNEVDSSKNEWKFKLRMILIQYE